MIIIMVINDDDDAYNTLRGRSNPSPFDLATGHSYFLTIFTHCTFEQVRKNGAKQKVELGLWQTVRLGSWY